MVLVCVIALLALSSLWGYKQGVIKIAISLASLIVTIAVAVVVAPMIARYVIDNTSVDEKMAESVYSVISSNKAVNDAFDSSFDVQNDLGEENKNEKQAVITNQLNKIGDRIELPKSVSEAISNISTEELNNIVIKYSGKSLKEIILRMFAERITNVIVHAIIYIIVMVIIFAALRIVIFATGIVNHLPVIKQANRLGGLGVGFVEGILVVWIFFAVLTAFGNNSFATYCLAEIHGNGFLEYIYDNNLITKILLNAINK